MKYLLHSYLCKHPSPNHHSETLLIRMSVHVIILPLIQPFKMPQETISSSTRIYKQSLLNSLKKETDAMLTHKHLKKNQSLKIVQHCPIDQKLFKSFFLRVKTPKRSLYRTQTSKRSRAVFFFTNFLWVPRIAVSILKKNMNWLKFFKYHFL